MNIKHLLITGDTHSRVEGRLAYIQKNMPEYKPEETAVVILGDAGLNYSLNKHDWKNKHWASKFGYTVYCLRGNHEERASNVKGMVQIQDDFVNGPVWYEPEFPNIRYFSDVPMSYTIMGKHILCIPGAYSVDKWYRLQNDWHWFADEQLTQSEMQWAEDQFTPDGEFDFVFSHTCPISWEPNDLFLRGIDQSKVDKTMEVWMDKFKDSIDWGIWLFGHYHADRIERPYVEMFYNEVEPLDTIFTRWDKYKETGELDWYLPKSPNFYMGV